METKIIDAIKKNKVIKFIYDGEYRLVEPHCYGLTTRGNEAIRAYQIDGFSLSGKMGWKMYDLSKVKDIILLDKIFEIRGDYKKGDKGMERIFCEL